LPLPANCFDRVLQNDDFIPFYAGAQDAGGVGLQVMAGKTAGVRNMINSLNVVELRRF
jgi:hypothetical protein